MATPTRPSVHLSHSLLSLTLLGHAAVCSAREAPAATTPVSQTRVSSNEAADPGNAAQNEAKRREPRTPLREQRNWSALAELGTNSWNNASLRLAYHVVPRFTLEGAVGATEEGYSAGGRARYNMTLSNVTPYLGLGVAHVFGSEKQTAASLRSDDEVQLRITPANYLHFSSGIDWVTRSNFTLLTTIGVAWRVEANNVEVLEEGKLSGDQLEALGRFGDRLFVAIAAGYTF